MRIRNKCCRRKALKLSLLPSKKNEEKVVDLNWNGYRGRLVL